MSKEALTPRFVQLGVAAGDWRDALRRGAVPLLNAGNITETYVDNMIQAVETLGPYIVIAPGIALGHARPDRSVLHTGFSLSTLTMPVEFGSQSNDPVDIVVILAAVDASSHINALHHLATFLGSKDNLALLRGASTPADIDEVVDRINKG
ncbi:PTS system, ascorbate-specific IIA component [Propionibacterium cyclohexanicum]|uniref:Ascorbate-specific PTS system EIIA component n=1 Tax=Propionibacterium cyclohexanicum TaxID=64702 RepID=A0A1H9QT42_9ACTN|nr:PTS sugar transporter subunit IIA [Propionibacterium cyclohexanicum]SER62873.1 PTS system, ascorbate-specific IIA component [Propionibacterium cyclohexanicum]